MTDYGIRSSLHGLYEEAGLWKRAVRADGLRAPAGEKRWDCFLSHHQQNAGDQCLMLRQALSIACGEKEESFISVWYDQDEEPTLSGMEQGVLSSDFFVLFMTSGVLERPFCRLEFERAVKGGKKIILVQETSPLDSACDARAVYESACAATTRAKTDPDYQIYDELQKEHFAPLLAAATPVVEYHRDERFWSTTIPSLLREMGWERATSSVSQAALSNRYFLRRRFKLAHGISSSVEPASSMATIAASDLCIVIAGAPNSIEQCRFVGQSILELCALGLRSKVHVLQECGDRAQALELVGRATAAVIILSTGMWKGLKNPTGAWKSTGRRLADCMRLGGDWQSTNRRFSGDLAEHWMSVLEGGCTETISSLWERLGAARTHVLFENDTRHGGEVSFGTLQAAVPVALKHICQDKVAYSFDRLRRKREVMMENVMDSLGIFTRIDGPGQCTPPLLKRDYNSEVSKTKLEEVLHLMLGEGEVAVTIGGKGGIGKTSLAAAVCADPSVRLAFSDEIYWLTLGNEMSRDNLLSKYDELLAAAGIPAPPAGEARCKTLSQFSKVIDDCFQEEHFQPFLEALSLANCTSGALTPHRVCVLFTTRVPEIFDRKKRELSRNAIREPAIVRVDDLTAGMALTMLKTYLICGAMSVSDRLLHELARVGGFIPLNIGLVGAALRKILQSPNESFVSLSVHQDAQAAELLGALAAATLPAGLEQSEYARTHRVIQAALSIGFCPIDIRKYRMLGIFREDTLIPELLIRTMWRSNAEDCRQLLRAFQHAGLLKYDDVAGTALLHDLQVDFVRSTLFDASEGRWTTAGRSLHSHLLDCVSAAYGLDIQVLPLVGTFRCWEQLGQRVFCRVSALPKTPAGALEQTLELGVAAYMGENIVVHIQAADLREEAEALLGWLPFLQERVTHSSWRYIIPWFGIATWLYPGMGDSELGTTVASDSWARALLDAMYLSNREFQRDWMRNRAAEALPAQLAGRLIGTQEERGLKKAGSPANTVATLLVEACRAWRGRTCSLIPRWGSLLRPGSSPPRARSVAIGEGWVAVACDSGHLFLWRIDTFFHAGLLSAGHVASTAIQLSVKSEHGGPWAHGLRAPIFVPTMSSTHLLCGGHSRKVFVWQLGDSNESDREPDSRLSLGTITESSCLVLREGTPPTVCFGGWDGGIRVMEQDVGTNTYVVKGVLRDDSDCEIVRVLSLCTLPGGRIASGGTDKVVRVWSLESMSRTCVLSGHSDWVSSVAFTSIAGVEVICSGSDDRTIRVWDATSGRSESTLDGHANEVHGVTVIPGASSESLRLISGDGGGELILWDMTREERNGLTTWGVQKTHIPDVHASISCLAMSMPQLGGRQFMVSASFEPRGVIGIWDLNELLGEVERKSDLASGKARARFLTPLSLMEEGRQVVFVTRLSDGRYATRAAGGSWGLWDVDGRAVLGNDPCQSASEMKEAQNEYEQRAHGNVSAAALAEHESFLDDDSILRLRVRGSGMNALVEVGHLSQADCPPAIFLDAKPSAAHIHAPGIQPPSDVIATIAVGTDSGQLHVLSLVQPTQGGVKWRLPRASTAEKVLERTE